MRVIVEEMTVEREYNYNGRNREIRLITIKYSIQLHCVWVCIVS